MNAKALLVFLVSWALASGVLFSKNSADSLRAGQSDGFDIEKRAAGVRVPFRLVGGVIVIPVRINGSRPLNMILDTGMSAGIVFLFHSELGQEIGLKYAQEVELGGAGGERGRSKANLAVGAQVGISDIVQTNQQIVVMNEPRETSRWTFDGIIGKSILDSHAVEIDYQGSVLIIYDPSIFKPENSGPAIPIALENGLPVIDASIDTEEEKGIPVKLVVDLGNRNPLVFNVNPRKKISFPKRTLSTVIGRGVQGELLGKVGRLPELEIGEFALQDVIALFAPEEGNAGAGPAGYVFDGNVGYGVLERFRIAFDYPQRRMFLIPREKTFQPFEFNMLGLSFEQRMDRSLHVRHVIAGSPGAENGIRAGDLITAVNGRDLKSYEFRDVEELFRKENKDIELTLLRGGKPMSVRLTLKRLI
jgi:hypothetical protein